MREGNDRVKKKKSMECSGFCVWCGNNYVCIVVKSDTEFNTFDEILQRERSRGGIVTDIIENNSV